MIAYRSHPDIQQFAHALGQCGCGHVAIIRYLVALQLRIDPGGAFVGMDGREQTQSRPLRNAVCRQHVVEDRFGQEHLRHLERPAQTKLGNISRMQADHAFAEKLDPAAGRGQIAGHHVDEGGFAGPVGADDADSLPLFDGYVDVVRRNDPAEVLFEIMYFQYANHCSTPLPDRRRTWTLQAPAGSAIRCGGTTAHPAGT